MHLVLSVFCWPYCVSYRLLKSKARFSCHPLLPFYTVISVENNTPTSRLRHQFLQPKGIWQTGQEIIGLSHPPQGDHHSSSSPAHFYPLIYVTVHIQKTEQNLIIHLNELLLNKPLCSPHMGQEAEHWWHFQMTTPLPVFPDGIPYLYPIANLSSSPKIVTQTSKATFPLSYFYHFHLTVLMCIPKLFSFILAVFFTFM